MTFLTKIFQHLRQLPAVGRMRKEDGLINTTDLLVATAATVVLASGVGAAVVDTLNESKYGKAQPDAVAIASAITAFYADTGKWPGQAEHALTPTVQKFLASTTDPALQPTVGTTMTLDPASCGNMSLEGFPNVNMAGGIFDVSSNVLDINDFLVNAPPEASYPSWQGPYLSTEIRTDPWDRAWVINLQPLYCAEDVVNGGGDTAGGLGYAWLLTGGTNRTVTTNLKDSTLDLTGDDAGINLGKLITPGAGAAEAS